MEYQIGPDETIPDAVIEATQQCEDTNCQSGENLSLYETIDPDALNDLFASVNSDAPRALGHVSFVFRECRVTVEHGEYLTIEPLGFSLTDAGKRL